MSQEERSEALIEAITDEQPRKYVVYEIGPPVTAAEGDREYTITSALIDAAGRRATNDDIDTYIDRHGIDRLATALTYAVDREHGEVMHRMMADDLDISPLAVEIILQALRPVAHEYFDVDGSWRAREGWSTAYRRRTPGTRHRS